MEVVAAPPAPVDLNLLRHQTNTEEFGYLQKVIQSTPSTASVSYPALQRERELAASAVPIVAAPPVVIVMQAPAATPPPPPSTPAEAPTSRFSRYTERLGSFLFQAGHNPDPVEPAEPRPVYEPRPVPQVAAVIPPSQQSHSYYQNAAIPPQLFSNPGVPSYAQTAGVQRTMTMASAPAETPLEHHVNSNPSAPYFSLLQEVSNRTPVDRLLRHNCNAGSVLAAGMTLSNFYDANYTLREVASLFPDYNQLVSVGLNKYFFKGRWSVRELSELYRIPMRNLVSTSGLSLTPEDLVACKFTVADLQELGFTVPMLQAAGADFMFWNQLKCTPAQFSALGGTVEHVAGMNLNEAQRQVLLTHGWNHLGVQVIPGLDGAQAVRIWPIGFRMK